MKHGFILGLTALFLVSCASTRMSDVKTNRLFISGKYDSAVKRLKSGLKSEGDGRDQLLWLMDLGLTLHTAGDYKQSNKYFLLADRIAEIKDYTSLASETSTFLISENSKHYKGEDFEKVLISTYLAMNFAFLGNYEDALVEARRVNRKLFMMINEGKRKYKQNEFARYLSAILYEASGELNDAYIDYKKALKLNAGIPGIGMDLYRVSKAIRFYDDSERWGREFKLSKRDREEAMKVSERSEFGELIVIFQNGISPRKIPNPHFNSLPKFMPRRNPVTHAKIMVNGKMMGETSVLYDIEYTAIRNLEEKYGAMVAKKIAGIVAKEAAGYAVEKATDSPLLGFIAKIFLYAADQADIRSWSLLPRDLQIKRIPLMPGEYDVLAQTAGVIKKLPSQKVTIKKGKKTFVTFRYTPRF